MNHTAIAAAVVLSLLSTSAEANCKVHVPCTIEHGTFGCNMTGHNALVAAANAGGEQALKDSMSFEIDNGECHLVMPGTMIVIQAFSRAKDAVIFKESGSSDLQFEPLSFIQSDFKP